VKILFTVARDNAGEAVQCGQQASQGDSAMVVQTNAIAVQSEDEVGQLLKQADEAPLFLERNGVRYRVSREPDDLFADYDPERVRIALEESRGALAGVDIEALKADLREQREQDSIGRPA
jgi:hypothetical protein